jgi:hypothetical protein
MLTSILGARLSWYQADGWVFDPVIVGPDIIEYRAARSSISRGTWRHRRRTASLLFLPGWPKI